MSYTCTGFDLYCNVKLFRGKVEMVQWVQTFMAFIGLYEISRWSEPKVSWNIVAYVDVYLARFCVVRELVNSGFPDC